jgi:hypothetical protein
VALVDNRSGRCSEFVIFWLDLASPSDPPISRGAIHERGLNRTPALITRPSEEPSNAQSEHVQDRIGARLRTGGSNAETEHDVSRTLLPGKVLAFHVERLRCGRTLLQSRERGDAKLVPVHLLGALTERLSKL